VTDSESKNFFSKWHKMWSKLKTDKMNENSQFILMEEIEGFEFKVLSEQRNFSLLPCVPSN